MKNVCRFSHLLIFCMIFIVSRSFATDNSKSVLIASQIGTRQIVTAYLFSRSGHVIRKIEGLSLSKRVTKLKAKNEAAFIVLRDTKSKEILSIRLVDQKQIRITINENSKSKSKKLEQCVAISEEKMSSRTNLQEEVGALMDEISRLTCQAIAQTLSESLRQKASELKNSPTHQEGLDEGNDDPNIPTADPIKIKRSDQH